MGEWQYRCRRFLEYSGVRDLSKIWLHKIYYSSSRNMTESLNNLLSFGNRQLTRQLATLAMYFFT